MWLGRISDEEKVARLKGAQVFCAPSLRGESFGVVLIEAMAAKAVKSGLAGLSGVIGHDEGRAGMPLRAIEFPRIRGGKHFDTATPWFQNMLREIGQQP